MTLLRSSSIKGRGVAFLVLLVCLFGSAAFGQPWDGNGVEGDPYLIYDACDMQAIGADANYWDAHFKLMADIDLSDYVGTEFNIIGYYIAWNDNKPFTGMFDGNGHIISNFTYDSNGVNSVGLFGYVCPGGQIINLQIKNVNVRAENGYYIGAIAGRTSQCIIQNCSSSGSVNGYSYVGGLIGYMYDGAMANCHSSATVSGDYDIGGLVGRGYCTMTNCYYEGVISASADYVGGLFGETEDGTITNCHSVANVSGNEYVGGLVGLNYSTISNCYSKGNITGIGDVVGGLLGYTNIILITKSYSIANVSGFHDIGGLIGYGRANIFNCYATGDVSGSGNNVGGLVGTHNGDNGGAFTYCYATGTVDGNNNVGGLLGRDHFNRGTFTGCFWNSDVNPDVNGIGNTTDPNVIGETTANMQTESTFTDAGWDFVGEVINGPNDIWTICEGEDYPMLAWEKYGGGNGTEANPYLIRTSCQMNAIGADSNDWDKHFKLMADIDLGGYTGTEFNIIGTAWNNAFTGVFDGNGHTISNFTYAYEDMNGGGIKRIGLFGCVEGAGADIRDLALINSNVEVIGGGGNVGSLIGRLVTGTVSRCYVEAGTVSACQDYDVGGLVGNSEEGLIRESYSTASVFGGIAAGGLVGYNEGAISDCHSSGDVTTGNFVGGLVGYNRSTILNCYFTGNVAQGSFIGGLAGYNWGGTITNCYSVGSVDGNSEVGGLLGHHHSGSYTKCFWDSDVNPDVNGIGNTTDPNVIGESTVNMQTESTFTDAGWDFVGEVINGPNDIWDICEGTNYPKFVWQIPAADFVCPDGVNFIDYAFFAEHWLQSIYGDCGKVELTGDGKVNWVDFALFAEYWKLTGCGECGGADFTGDENVDLADLYVFATYWLGFEYAEVDLTKDGQVGLDDLREFTENWLAGM